MRRQRLAGGALCAALVLCAASARAEWGIATSLGTGLMISDSTQRAPVNLELIPFVGFGGRIYADLGMTYTFERGFRLGFRPGLRFDLSWLYLRTAIPLQATGGHDYGLYLGMGRLFRFDMLSIFVEVGKQVTRELGAGAAPIELRMGAQLEF